MTALDPRAQLAWLVALLVATFAGADVGLASTALLSLAGVIAAGAVAPWLRLVGALAPLVVMVAALNALAGLGSEGVRPAARLVIAGTAGFAFARAASGEQLAAGLRALRVPYPIVFTLVTGARFIPTAAADLANLRDAARLRGVRLDGPPWSQLAGWRRLLVPLLVGTVRRGLQLGEAMEARAFGASPRRTTRHRLAWRLTDSLALGAATAYAIVATVVAR